MWQEQDFKFACEVYPAHAEFVQSVRQEVIDNVKRLRHHPSIALFCGNNEGAPRQIGSLTSLFLVDDASFPG